jgi:YD repeat-containing protein
VTNGLGQVVREAASAAGGAERITEHSHDAHGRVVLSVSSGSAAQQTLYDAYGRVAGRRVLLTGTASGNDPLTTHTVAYQTQGGGLWEVSTTRQAVDADSANDLVTVNKRRLGGAEQVQTALTADGALITQTTTVNRATATVTTTTTSNRASGTAVRVVVNGLLQSETGFAATNPTTYTYDGLERPVSVTTPEGITRETVYDDAGGVARSRVKEERLIPAGGGTAVTEKTGSVCNCLTKRKSIMPSPNLSDSCTLTPFPIPLTPFPWETGSGCNWLTNGIEKISSSRVSH